MVDPKDDYGVLGNEMEVDSDVNRIVIERSRWMTPLRLGMGISTIR